MTNQTERATKEQIANAEKYWERMTRNAIRKATEAMGKTFEINIDEELTKEDGITGYIARQIDGCSYDGEIEAQEILEEAASKAFDGMTNRMAFAEVVPFAEKAYDILTDARNAMDDE